MQVTRRVLVLRGMKDSTNDLGESILTLELILYLLRKVSCLEKFTKAAYT